jgi:nucleoside-diphosphate-sugar epimerase
MNPIRKIAIIGATGMLGIPVTVALLDAGFAVTETLRAEETWRDLGRPSTTIEEFARTITT